MGWEAAMQASGHQTSATRISAGMSWRGHLLLVLVAVLVVGGMWRVDGVMVAMGLAGLVLLLLTRLMGRWNLAAVSVDYRGPRRVEAGKGFQARMWLRNERAWLDAFGIEFGVEPGGGKRMMGRAVWLESGGEVEIGKRLVLSKRNWWEAQRGWLRSDFPLGLHEFRVGLTLGSELGVLPRARVPQELLAGGYLHEGPPDREARNAGDSGEWRTLREWRGGDAVRRVAWAGSLRSQAAGRGLLVREDEPPGSQAEACLAVFHSYGTDGSLIRPDRFEKALELFSGGLAEMLKWGIPLRVVTDFDDWREQVVRTRGHLAEVREGLMRAVRAAGTEAHDLQAAVGKAGEEDCLVIFSDMPADVWRSVLPKRKLGAMVVDVTNYEKSSRIRKGVGR